MATLREYFDTDCRVLTMHAPWTLIAQSTSEVAELVAKVAYDFEANARYLYVYVPEIPDLAGCLALLLRSEQMQRGQLTPQGDGVRVETGHGDYSERQSTDTLQFTRRVHLYVDLDLTEQQRTELVAQAGVANLFLTVRDREYARTRSHLLRPLAFISHDSRDKDAFVRELAGELSKQMCTVWYDEFSLKVGDSLRASIERGLREAQKCIVVLSANFLANEGWGRAEFDSVFTREILDRENVILPVWLNVEVRDVYNYSPRLADKVGVPASLGAAEVARRLTAVLKAGA